MNDKLDVEVGVGVVRCKKAVSNGQSRQVNELRVCGRGGGRTIYGVEYAGRQSGLGSSFPEADCNLRRATIELSYFRTRKGKGLCRCGKVSIEY